MDSSKSFTHLAVRHIHHAQECLRQLLDDLREGSILIGNLQLLMFNHDQFLALVEADGGDKASVEAVLHLRTHELQAFISTASHLDRLLAYCKQYIRTGVDMPDIR